MRYMAAYFDTNGVGRLVGDPNDFADEAEAKARIKAIEDDQTKEHKVDYRVVPYHPGHKSVTMAYHKIAT